MRIGNGTHTLFVNFLHAVRIISTMVFSEAKARTAFDLQLNDKVHEFVLQHCLGVCIGNQE